MEEKVKKRPWHLWTVAILGFLWYLSGAITIFLAQAGSLQGISPDEAEYYANQSLLVCRTYRYFTYCCPDWNISPTIKTAGCFFSLWHIFNDNNYY